MDMELSNKNAKVVDILRRLHYFVANRRETDDNLLQGWSGTTMKDSVFSSFSLSMLRVIHDLMSVMHDESRKREP